MPRCEDLVRTLARSQCCRVGIFLCYRVKLYYSDNGHNLWSARRRGFFDSVCLCGYIFVLIVLNIQSNGGGGRGVDLKKKFRNNFAFIFIYRGLSRPTLHCSSCVPPRAVTKKIEEISNHVIISCLFINL